MGEQNPLITNKTFHPKIQFLRSKIWAMYLETESHSTVSAWKLCTLLLLVLVQVVG